MSKIVWNPKATPMPQYAVSLSLTTRELQLIDAGLAQLREAGVVALRERLLNLLSQR